MVWNCYVISPRTHDKIYRSIDFGQSLSSSEQLQHNQPNELWDKERETKGNGISYGWQRVTHNNQNDQLHATQDHYFQYRCTATAKSEINDVCTKQ